MAVGTFYLTTNGYGTLAGTPGTSWATIRASTTGSVSANSLAMTTSKDGVTFYLGRFFIPFNTSSIPVGSVINSATISLYRDDAVRAFSNTNTDTLELIPSSQSDPTTLATGDMDNISFSTKGSVSMASTSNGAYFNFTLSDLTQVVAGGYTKLAVVAGRDYSNTAPTGDTFIGCQNAAAANPPKIVVNYTPPSGSALMSFMV